MSRDEFVDTTLVHEPAHTLTWDKHGRKWYFQYRDNQKISFRRFSRFINAKNILPTKSEKEYKIYPYGYERERGIQGKAEKVIKNEEKAKVSQLK